ncbi:MAG: glycosyltransferase [Patescibacteria group bacterium]
MKKVVIVMPTYKEAENIGRMIDELVGKEFPRISGADMYLLVVNDLPLDGSSDGTGDIVRKKIEKYKNLYILENKKQGLGWAYIRGMKYAMTKLGADAVMEMDADFQHPPRFVKDMVKAYVGGADYVIGARYIPGGSVPKEWALSRRAVSFLGNLFIRLVWLKLKYHDLTTGFRLTKVKGVLNKIDLDNLMEPTRFAYKVDLLYQSIKNAKKVKEVPLEFAPRTKEKSKFDTKEMIATFKVAIILGIKDKARFVKFGTVGFIGYLVNAIALELFSGTALASSVASIFNSLQDTFLAFIAEPSAWAAAIAAEFAIINNFTLNNIWTFKKEEITGVRKILYKFLQFNLTTLGAIVIQFIVIGVMVVTLSDTRLVRQAGILVAMPLVLTYNYLMYNLVIWKTWKLPWNKSKDRGKKS